MELPDLSHYSSHLHELRHRVMVSFGAIVLFSSISYFFRIELADLVVAPLFTAYPQLDNLVYTNLTEAFFSYLKLAILTGIIFSFPIILYQAWTYIAPGLHKSEKKISFQVVFFASLLFAGGATFAFLIVMPKALSFFMNFAGPELQPMPKFGSYFTFVARSCLAFGLAFEIPFLMVATAKIGWVDKGHFTKKRPYFYLAIVILSFLLTAGDLLSALLLALPLFGLYEAGILVMLLFV